MELVEFLMRNFWLVFIIIAILSGLSRGGKKPNQNRDQMPPFGGGGQQQPHNEQPGPSRRETFDEDYDEAEYEESRGGMLERPEARREAEVKLSRRLQEIEDKMRKAAAVPDTRPQLAHDEIGSVDMIQQRLKDSDSPIFRQQEDSGKAEPKANDLRRKAMEGIIWAEILGPPRAKKKHRRS